MGRPKKPTAEKETERVAFSLTHSETQKLLEKTGGLTVGVFIKNYIRESTDLLK